MLVIFQGDPIENAKGGGLSRTSLVIEGVLFPLGQMVDASSLSARMKQKLQNNPHFEVMGVAPQPASFAPSAEQSEDAADAAETEAHVQRARAKKQKPE